MRIKKVVLQNVKSFRDEVSVEFKKGLNVLIGPNAGGKSNLMDILNISLLHYFIHTWVLRPRTTPGGLIEYHLDRINPFHPIKQFLDKNLETESQNQKITVCFEVTEEDMENIQIIRGSKDKLVEFERKEYGSNSLGNLVFLQHTFLQNKKPDVEYQINEYSEPINNNQDVFAKGFLQYLNYFGLISILIEEYNKTSSEGGKIGELFPLSLYFSPYRSPAIQNLRVSIAGQDEVGLIEAYKKTTSKDISSILQYANFYFALKLRYYDDKPEKFSQDKEIEFIQRYIKKLGYANFEVVPIDKRTNTYEVTLKKGQKDIRVTQASSGEKEIISLLLGLFALNVKGGIVIIDLC